MAKVVRVQSLGTDDYISFLNQLRYLVEDVNRQVANMWHLNPKITSDICIDQKNCCVYQVVEVEEIDPT